MTTAKKGTANTFSGKAATRYINESETGSVERTLRELEMLGAVATNQGRIPASSLRFLMRKLRRQMKGEK